MRNYSLQRNTNETKINAALELDGKGNSEISTGIAFFDHMLILLAKHSKIDLKVECIGDIQVDGHHTVEDTGIVIGQALAKALGEKKGICRYASTRVPMDEALVSCDMDISGRPFLMFNAKFVSPKVGGFETALTEEFFRALAFNSQITLHINCEYGKNDHHLIEGIFKSFARALREAVKIDPEYSTEIPSTKGVL
jgi:imidazoleglycerol-phosphate dehydratase